VHWIQQAHHSLQRRLTVKMINVAILHEAHIVWRTARPNTVCNYQVRSDTLKLDGVPVQYWLRAGRSSDRNPVGTKFSAPVQTGIGAHPTACTMGTGSFKGLKSGRGVYRVLVGKPKGKKSLGRPRRRWVDIRMNLQEEGCGYMDWIGLAQNRDRWRTIVSAVMNPRVPWNAGNFLTSFIPVSFSRRTLHHGVSK